MKRSSRPARLLAILCLACLALAAIGQGHPRGSAAGAGATYRAEDTAVVGYYAGWAAYQGYPPSALPAHLLTHINYAFATIDPERGELALGDPDHDRKALAALRQLREEHPHLELLISVGGWDYSTYFSDVASTAARRDTFARSCAAFLAEHGLDGIDLDWEYPVSGGLPGTIHRPQDGENFTLLLQAIRARLDEQGERDGKDYLLTVAGAASEGYLRDIQPQAVAEVVDHIFLMAYDIHGPWDSYADLNAPLYAPSERSPQYQNSVADSIQAYLDAGVPPEKLVLGMPLYGYLYQGVSGRNDGLYSTFTSAKSVSYDALVRRYLSDSAYRQLRHQEAQVPYLYGNGSFLSYEDPQSMAAKGELARSLGLGGIGFWELSQDRSAVLIESARAALAGWPFSDVGEAHWSYDAVAFVYEKELMTGTSATTFSPGLPTTRGMLVTVLHRLEGAPSAGDAPFSDVPSGAYYRDAAAWAAGQGIVEGYGDGRFGPEDPVTREQLAAVLHRYLRYKGEDVSASADLSGYADAEEIGGYALAPMGWAVASGLLEGRAEDILAPLGTASRAECAAVFQRLSALMSGAA